MRHTTSSSKILYFKTKRLLKKTSYLNMFLFTNVRSPPMYRRKLICRKSFHQPRMLRKFCQKIVSIFTSTTVVQRLCLNSASFFHAMFQKLNYNTQTNTYLEKKLKGCVSITFENLFHQNNKTKFQSIE